MVAIVQTTPRTAEGGIDRTAWFNVLSIRYPKEKLAELSHYFAMASERGLEIANILLELHADLDAILAALLIESPTAVPAQIGPLLKSVEDLNRVGQTLFLQKKASKIEGVRAMMLAMIKDVRVVLVKLAERTYAARQMKLLPVIEQEKLAREIMELYAPLANRLGIGALKWELEDRAFSILEPKAYQEITQVLKVRRAEREAFIHNFLENLERALEAEGMHSDISGRVKHIYSIWRKMQKKHLQFQDLYDVRAVRVLVRDVPSCYTVMALLHQQWKPLVSEYTDYIAHPKANGYRSLHTILEGEDGLPIEVQIRSFGMHEQAERGVAAHWRYKEGGHETLGEERVKWLRTLLDWQSEVSAGTLVPKTLDQVIYVFTKDNEVVVLTEGATPIDFAFLVHTTVGLSAKGALVNGRMAPLTHALETGDQVEILTHKEPHPSRDWLLPSAGFTTMAHSRRKLRAYFRSIEEKNEGLDSRLRGNDSSAMAEPLPLARGSRRRLKASRPRGISLSGIHNMPFQLARCCNPSEGEPIIASMTRTRGLVIHKTSCGNIAYFEKQRKDRMFAVEWEHQ